MSIKAESAYERGYRCYRVGRGRNPYTPGTNSFILWQGGFNDAKTDDDAKAAQFAKMLDAIK